MAVFPLHTYNKEGTTLYPQSSSYSEEYAGRMCSWYLTDHISKDTHGKLHKHYRLHSCKERTFADYMGYDIICPNCGGRLHPIENAQNYHDLALYACRNCEKK